MKQKIYIFGVITALIVSISAIFKVNHLAGASILLTAGLVTLVMGFIPAALVNLYRSEKTGQNPLLYIVTGITCFVVFTAMLFKIQHWPFAEILLIIAVPFPYVVFLPVFLSITSKNKNFNIYNVVAVLSLLALNSVISALLALNVSKSKIEDSYKLSDNYIRTEMVLMQLPDHNSQTSLDLKINEVCKIVDEYQDVILKSEGLSREQWSNDPGNLWRPDARSAAAEALIKADGLPVAGRLEAGLKSLISEMENTKGYGELANSAPVFFDLTPPDDSERSWGDWIFRDNTLSWSLIYLDGLKVNLRMIKTSASKNY